MTNLAEQDYSLVIWPETISQKDINDMTLAGVRDIEQIINDNTYSGLQARMRVASWKRI